MTEPTVASECSYEERLSNEIQLAEQYRYELEMLSTRLRTMSKSRESESAQIRLEEACMWLAAHTRSLESLLEIRRALNDVCPTGVQ